MVLTSRDTLVERDAVGAVVSARKQSLVRRWAQDYGLTTTNDTVSVLAPRGIDRMLDGLTRYQEPYALTGAARGANVLLVEPFDDIVYRGATMHDGLRYVSPSQAVVDLLTGPGRSPEEASQLADALGRQDQEWSR